MLHFRSPCQFCLFSVEIKREDDSVDNPNIAEKADEFINIFTEAIKAHRFENLKMLYLGRKRR